MKSNYSWSEAKAFQAVAQPERFCCVFGGIVSLVTAKRPISTSQLNTYQQFIQLKAAVN